MKYFFTFFLGVSLTWLSYQYYNNIFDPIEMDCKIQLKSLSERLSVFKKACGNLPDENLGLKALKDPKSINCTIDPIIDEVPLDPWDREFIYFLRNDSAYLLGSKPECGYEFVK